MRAASLLTIWLTLGDGLTALADDPRALAAKLAADLAHPNFHDREAASRQLLTLGTAAVPALEEVHRAGPPEAVRRAARALAAIRLAEDSRQAVEAKLVALNFQGKPLATAIVELQTMCGANVALDPKGVADPNRPVTVRTKELPPWQAVEAFRAAARLQEVTPLESDRPDTRELRIESRYQIRTAATARPSDVPVVWRDGEQPARPTAAASGLRVVALPGASRDPANGTVTLTLDVTTTAGLNWQRTDEVRVGKVETTDGRRLEPVFVSDANPATTFGTFYRRGLAELNELDADSVAFQLPRPARLFPVTLATDRWPANSLKLLEGVVRGEVHRTNQTLLEIDDLPAAVGRTFDGPLGSTLTVDAVKPGQVVLRCTAFSPWVLRQQGLARTGGIAAAGFDSSVEQRVRFLDATGRELRKAGNAYRTTGDGTRETTALTLDLTRVGADLPKPVKLIVSGTKVVPVRVPFRLENIPLK